jgi:hypothetical protein
MSKTTMSKPAENLRGEAAWKAAKQEISDRNEAAYARGRKDRVARNANFAVRRMEQEREANRDLPSRGGASRGF